MRYFEEERMPEVSLIGSEELGEEEEAGEEEEGVERGVVSAKCMCWRAIRERPVLSVV